ncbi:rab proteins geranylgeranyltransferase component [Phytophthora cinnamomi]|uniref:rab proteins geranylgeranyltransferase component n=1 Tax=Phytophthora cinnamomi TaxID=4785 RepID=UPI00355AC969|nr:rab proteins geranylgeranyltransferase component [Phytophthora cinnamomi]
MDASLKETEYDVLLVGTGMVEGILAGALARVGKKVLHLDQNDYYGSNYASFPLAQFLRWTKNENIAPRNFGDEEENCQVEKKAGETAPIDADNQRVLPMKSSFECRLLEEGFADEATKEELLRQSSSFSIDVNPRLMLSSEQLVEILITSGVGRYLEFAAIERTYVHFQQPVSGAKADDGAEPDTVWEVPCSKKDVFQSKLLGMVEKRQLMKFLQFVADYGETHILHEDVKTKNERTLALGRALKRPQNKASQADGDAELEKYLDRPFQELLEKHFKLSSKLQQVVVYCVGLASFPATKNQISAREGLEAVYRYVASIGRFTGTAFLAPLYGISELAQSFCRLSAVYGGIYVLRAPIDGFVLDTETNELRGVHCSDGDVLRSKHVVTNGSYVDNLRIAKNDEPTHTHGQILRGVFVLKSSMREGMNRLMLVIPPEDSEFQNPFAIQVIQLDVGAYACPKGYFLVQISMPLPTEWFGQTEKQQTLVQSVIRRLILSSESELQQKQGQQSAAKVEVTPKEPTGDTAVEADAGAAINSTDATPPTKPSWSDRIAWRVIFTMDHLASGDAKLLNVSAKATDLPANAWVCETSMAEFDGVADPQKPSVGSNAASPLEIHLESASANARAIFEALCPGEPFLPKSASAEQAEQEEQESEEDAVLRAAQKLAQQTQLAKEQQEGGLSGTAADGGVVTAVVTETKEAKDEDVEVPTTSVDGPDTATATLNEEIQ